MKEEEMLLEPKPHLRFQLWGANRIYIENEMVEAKQSEFIERECAGQLNKTEASKRPVSIVLGMSFIIFVLPFGGKFCFR